MDLQNISRLSDALTAEYLEFNAVIPLLLESGVVRVGTWRDAIAPAVLDEISILLDAVPQVEPIPEQEGRAAIQRIYGGEGLTAESLIAGLDPSGSDRQDIDAAIDDLRSLANEAPVIQLVNLLLVEALDARASDVHLESGENGFRVRYRVDGVLQDAPAPPLSMRAAMLSRIRIMAELDIAERRVPQDGRIRLRLRDRHVDVRVSTVPVLHGESMVLRLLDRAGGRMRLDEVGMDVDTLRGVEVAVSHPNGIILVTGPTGSGKTTTLYGMVDRIRTGREKILTVEDPVEYELAGVAQMAVNAKAGVSFASALRSLLRQDPDVLLVGEIRDSETADVAMQAALTGHLVLSTMHTNDAPGAITRLLDLGVPDYLIGSALRAVLAQRLVRRLCTSCGGSGCSHCRGSGYRGRTGIYELLLVDDAIREEIPRRRGVAELRRIAVARGMRTLEIDGERWIASGATTREEVVRVAGS